MIKLTCRDSQVLPRKRSHSEPSPSPEILKFVCEVWIVDNEPDLQTHSSTVCSHHSSQHENIYSPTSWRFTDVLCCCYSRTMTKCCREFNAMSPDLTDLWRSQNSVPSNLKDLTSAVREWWDMKTWSEPPAYLHEGKEPAGHSWNILIFFMWVSWQRLSVWASCLMNIDKLYNSWVIYEVQQRGFTVREGSSVAPPCGVTWVWSVTSLSSSCVKEVV